jgi:endonuclease-3
VWNLTLVEERAPEIVKRLTQAYPDATVALTASSSLEMLVATILSAQCTDARVNLVTPALFRRYRTAADYAAADPAELEGLIHSTGFFRNKTRSIIGLGKALVLRHGGEVPDTMEDLVELPGVARKTANVVLGTSYGIASGVVVDTHVQRIPRRLDLTKESDPVKIERDLMKIIPRDRWILFSHQIIHHGRGLCVARNPKCAECPLDPLCYAKDKTV